MGRRQVVESANAALKGAFADLSRGFVRVFGRTKITCSFRAKRRAEAEQPKPRAKRRSGTWRELVAEPSDTAPSPLFRPD